MVLKSKLLPISKQFKMFPIKSRINGYRAASLLFLLILLIGNSVCNAHHNFGLHYDSSKMVTITGIVKRYAFINPHIEIELEVKEGANTTQWKVETINARLAATYDLQKDSFKGGIRLKSRAGRPRTAQRLSAGTSWPCLADRFLSFDVHRMKVRLNSDPFTASSGKKDCQLQGKP